MKKKIIILFIIVLSFFCNHSYSQSYSEILGRPTNSEITISVMFDQNMEVYWEYGMISGTYTNTTSRIAVQDSIPFEVVINNLLPDTKYYYRIRYRSSGSSAVFLSGAEHSFHTQRPKGACFSFAVEADPHLDTNTIPASFELTLQNMLSKNVDFMIDLGDNFLSEKYILKPGQQNPIENYRDTIKFRTELFRSYYGQLCHSAPLFLTLGNHEGELGWRYGDSVTSMPVVAANYRKLYYPNPYPNSFYSGNDSLESYVGLRQNYYAWEWGDALFMVIDPYWYTKGSKHAGWGWTLGKRQYDWFKNTISNSSSKFKFIFSHQLVGGNGNDARGGAEYADLYENGGRSPDSTWYFDSARIHWQQPLHSLMLQNNATIYFHGHDHFYGKQDKDGIVYQEVPQPSAKNINAFNTNSYPFTSQYGYLSGTILPNRGFLLVTVCGDSVKVEYIKTFLPNEENGSRHNKDVAHSYVIKNSAVSDNSVYVFNGDGNWDVPSNWQNNLIPPAVLPNGSTIIIDPVSSGKCILNVTQIISPGANIEVKAGKNFLLPGTLIRK